MTTAAKHTTGKWHYRTAWPHDGHTPTITIFAEDEGEGSVDICIMENICGYPDEPEANAKHICALHNAGIPS